MKTSIKIALCAASIVCLFSSSANAQNAVGSWSLQPKAGLNLATMTNDDDAKIRVGLVADVVAGTGTWVCAKNPSKKSSQRVHIHAVNSLSVHFFRH